MVPPTNFGGLAASVIITRRTKENHPSFKSSKIGSCCGEQEDLSRYPPDSEAQQAAVSAIAAEDAFNWGYDPVHWSTPEGSYASDPDGPTRILEYRGMVQALHRMGLRVVFDTVYNHTFHSGLDGMDHLSK